MEKFATKIIRSSAALGMCGVFAGILLSALSAIAQSPSSPPGSVAEIKESLIQIEREIGRANFDCDYKYFARIEAEEFIFTDANGGTTTRKEDLAGEKDCHKFAGSYDLDQTQVSVYGNSAVVTARVTIAGKNKEGNAFVRRSRFTDVFVWRDGGWRIVAGHSSKIPEAK